MRQMMFHQFGEPEVREIWFFKAEACRGNKVVAQTLVDIPQTAQLRGIQIPV